MFHISQCPDAVAARKLRFDGFFFNSLCGFPLCCPVRWTRGWSCLEEGTEGATKEFSIDVGFPWLSKYFGSVKPRTCGFDQTWGERERERERAGKNMQAWGFHLWHCFVFLMFCLIFPQNMIPMTWDGATPWISLCRPVVGIRWMSLQRGLDNFECVSHGHDVYACMCVRERL